MKKISNYYLTAKNHPYTKGVFFVAAGSLVGNLSNYLFHVIGGRYLGPLMYGGLASLISLLYIVSIFAAVFSTAALRELTKLWARGERDKFYLLFRSLFSFFTIGGATLFLTFFLGSPFITNYLSLKSSSFVFLVGIIGFLTMVSFLFGAFQQATLRFKEFSFFNAAASLAKIIFVFLTWCFNLLISGMLWAIILSVLLYLLLSVFDFYLFAKRNLEKVKIENQPVFSLKNFLKKSSFVLVAQLGMTGFLTSDIILVKHLFPSLESGLYAGVAVMGRVILFATGPLLIVMMPFVVKRKEQKQNFRKIFFLTLFLVFLCSMALLVVYSFFPKIIIMLFYGSRYLKALPLLPLFSIYMLFYTLSNVFATYYIAMEEKKILFLPLGGAGLQIVLINLFHQSLAQVINISTLCSALLLASFLIKFISSEKGYEKIQR